MDIINEVVTLGRNNLKTLENLFKVLDEFSFSNNELGITELSNSLKLSKSVIHRILSTLEENNYLYQNKDNDKYKIGHKFIKLGELAKENFQLKDIAEDELLNLADKSGETILVDVLNGEKSICVYKKECNKNIKYTCGIGEEVPLYAGAIGKVLLAYSSKDKQEEILGGNLIKHTRNTLVNKQKLKKELIQIKEQGFCITYGEWNPGAIGIAAPVLNHNNKIIASVGILGPEFRMKDDIKKLTKECKTTAELISKKIK